MNKACRWCRRHGLVLVVSSAVGCAGTEAPAPDTSSRSAVEAGRNLGIRSVPNLRDLGGYRTADGKTVATGLLYHSNQLSEIAPDDMERVAALKLRNAFDLRTTEERTKRPEELPPGVRYVVVDVLADSPQAGPAQLETP